MPRRMPSISAGDALALLRLESEVVDVLVVDDALNGDIERNFLRGGKIAIGLLLSDDRQSADPKGLQLRDPRRTSARASRARPAGNRARS